MWTVAAVLAGGSGQRFGSGTPKQFETLVGRTILEHAVSAFEQAPGVDEIVVVSTAEHAARARELLAGCRKLIGVVDGGLARPDSTRRAIAAIERLTRTDCAVLLHDAARPLIEQRTIAECVTALEKSPAIGVAVPTSDTIVEVDNGMFRRVLPRGCLARCQTPQGFHFAVIKEAYARAAADPGFAASPATDDCGVVLRYLPEVGVRLVPGSERNLKITYPADLVVAAALLSTRS